MVKANVAEAINSSSPAADKKRKVSETSQMASHLPADALCVIASFSAKETDAPALMRVCRSWYHQLEDYELFWKQLYRNYLVQKELKEKGKQIRQIRKRVLKSLKKQLKNIESNVDLKEEEVEDNPTSVGKKQIKESALQRRVEKDPEYVEIITRINANLKRQIKRGGGKTPKESYRKQKIAHLFEKMCTQISQLLRSVVPNKTYRSNKAFQHPIENYSQLSESELFYTKWQRILDILNKMTPEMGKRAVLQKFGDHWVLSSLLIDHGILHKSEKGAALFEAAFNMLVDKCDAPVNTAQVGRESPFFFALHTNNTKAVKKLLPKYKAAVEASTKEYTAKESKLQEVKEKIAEATKRGFSKRSRKNSKEVTAKRCAIIVAQHNALTSELCKCSPEIYDAVSEAFNIQPAAIPYSDILSQCNHALLDHLLTKFPETKPSVGIFQLARAVAKEKAPASIAILTTCVKHGVLAADTDITNRYGDTILHYTLARASSLEFAQSLLDVFPSVDLKALRNRSGSNLLHAVIRKTDEKPKVRAQVIELLVKAYGFDPNGAEDSSPHKTPLFIAAACLSKTRYYNMGVDHREPAKVLLDLGADPNGKPATSSTVKFSCPLSVLCKQKNSPVGPLAELMLEKGATVTTETPWVKLVNFKQATRTSYAQEPNAIQVVGKHLGLL